MIKRVLLLILLFPCLVFGFNDFATFQGSNYANDANCVAYYRFDGAANGPEVNHCSGGGTSITDDTSGIGTSTTVPGEWVGATRVTQAASSEFFYHADGNETDLSGDIDISWGGRFAMNSDTALDQYIVNKYYADTGKRQYALTYNDSADFFQCIVSDNGTVYGVAEGTTAPTKNGTTFYDVVCTYEDTVGISIFVNGVEEGTGYDCSGGATNCDSVYNGSATFNIGVRSDGTTDGRFFDGKWKEAWVMDRLLSDAEIAEISVYGFDGQRGHSD